MCFAPQRRALFRHIISVLYILIWKRASCHNGVHFFDITTSKSAPTLVCFVHFDLEMRFAPQRRATSSLIWPDGSAPAALASLLFDHPEPQTIGNPQCFAALLPFRAPVFFLLALSLLWSCLFCSSPLWLFPPLLFHLPILSEVWLLNFLMIIFPLKMFLGHWYTQFLDKFRYSSPPKDRTLSNIRHGWWSFTTLWPLLQLPFLFQVATALRLSIEWPQCEG